MPDRHNGVETVSCRSLDFLSDEEKEVFATLKKKRDKGLLTVLNRLLENSGRATLDSRVLRKIIKDKNYKEWLEAHGIEQDTANGYQAARGKSVQGRSYHYKITKDIRTITGTLGRAVKIFMPLKEEERADVVHAHGIPFEPADFMPLMVALAKENGVKVTKLRRRYGNYYGISSNIKLAQCKPGMVEVDVHAMNPFSLCLLAEGPINQKERSYYLELFEGPGFYENLRHH